MTVKNMNILFTINKSNVHEPVDFDTCIVFSKAKNEELSAQSQALTGEQSTNHCHVHADTDSDDQLDVDETDDDDTDETRARGHRAREVASQLFNVEGNDALKQDAEEQICISPRPEPSWLRRSGTARQNNTLDME